MEVEVGWVALAASAGRGFSIVVVAPWPAITSVRCMTLGGADALHGKAAGLPWRAACAERRAGHAGGLHRDDDVRPGVVRCIPKACMVVSCCRPRTIHRRFGRERVQLSRALAEASYPLIPAAGFWV